MNRPYTSKVKRSLYFSEPQYNSLQAEALDLGLTLSELLRRIIDEHFDKKPIQDPET